VIRATLLGAVLGAGVFLLVGLYLNGATGYPVLSNPGPVAVLVVIGGTVGGLVAPLVRRRVGSASRHEARED